MSLVLMLSEGRWALGSSLGTGARRGNKTNNACTTYMSRIHPKSTHPPPFIIISTYCFIVFFGIFQQGQGEFQKHHTIF
jgi:hypothetical protein